MDSETGERCDRTNYTGDSQAAESIISTVTDAAALSRHVHSGHVTAGMCETVKLEAGHSIECKLMPAARSPSICFCTL